MAPDRPRGSRAQVTASEEHRISLEARIDAGMPLEIVASRYHPVDVSEDNGRYTVTLADDAVPLDHDFELVWRPVPSAAPRAMLFQETIAGQPHYLLMGVPPVGVEGKRMFSVTEVDRQIVMLHDVRTMTTTSSSVKERKRDSFPVASVITVPFDVHFVEVNSPSIVAPQIKVARLGDVL